MAYLNLENLSKSFKDDKIISNLNAKIEKVELATLHKDIGNWGNCNVNPKLR